LPPLVAFAGPAVIAPFVVANADVRTDFDFGALALDGAEGQIVLVPNPEHHPRGDFALHDGMVLDSVDCRFTFSGVGVYRPELFAGCSPGKFPLAPLLRRAMADGRVSGEVYAGFWMDIGTIDRLQAFDEYLRSNRKMNASIGLNLEV
ncbi:MAG: hypothetical protein LOY00_11425, partial [Methylocaldum sp.]|nr:hypothetical protein [Methylocaldum sp.]